jgi:PAS domain-containing protein
MVLAMAEEPITHDLFSPLSEDGLKAILNGIGEGFYAVDGQWRILMFNNEAAEHFKRTSEEVLCHSACNIDPLSRGIGIQN